MKLGEDFQMLALADDLVCARKALSLGSVVLAKQHLDLALEMAARILEPGERGDVWLKEKSQLLDEIQKLKEAL